MVYLCDRCVALLDTAAWRRTKWSLSTDSPMNGIHLSGRRTD